jgi:LemA protein
MPHRTDNDGELTMRFARIAVVVALAGALGGCGYNRIQALEEQVDQQRANVGVELTNRNQLIPNLVATVRGAAEFERGTYTDVARARTAQARDASQMADADAAVTRQIGTFINVAREAYPNLTATENFRGLQDQLAESENRIARARRDYNESVRGYNTYIRQFPQAITARVTGAQRKEPYREPAGSEQAPTVDFGTGTPKQ